jgi:hypothetical protein
MRTRTLTTAAIAASGLLLAGCGSLGAGTVNTNAANTTAATHAPASTGSKKAGLGDAISLTGEKTGDSIAVTLVKVVDPDRTGDQYSTPAAGTRYVSIQLRLKNTGAGSYSDDPQIDVTVKDAKGQTYQPDFAADQMGAGPQLSSSVDLAAGDVALGTLTFDVPAGEKVVQVVYALNAGMYGNAAEWTVR